MRYYIAVAQNVDSTTEELGKVINKVAMGFVFKNWYEIREVHCQGYSRQLRMKVLEMRIKSRKLALY